MSDTASGSSAVKRSSRIGLTPLVDFFNREIPIFAVLSTIETNQAFNLVVIGFIITAFQHLGFVLNPHYSHVWGSILGGTVADAFYGFHFAIFDAALTPSAGPATIFALLSILLLMALFLCATVGYFRIFRADTDKQHEAFVYALRGVVHLLSTVLLIPSLQLSFGVLVCDARGYVGLLPGSEKCWSGRHIGMFIMASLYILVALPMTFIALTCQFDPSVRSAHLRARAHSMADVWAFAHAVSSSFLFAVMIPYNQAGGFAVLHAASACSVAISYWWYLPHYAMNVNRFLVSMHTVEAFAAAVAAGVFFADDRVAAASTASVVLLGGAPIVVVVAWAVSTSRLSSTFIHALAQAQQGLSHRVDDDVEMRPLRGLVSSEDFARSSLKGIDQLLLDAQLKSASDAVSVSSVSRKPRLYPAVVEPLLDTVYLEADVELAARFCALYAAVLRQPPSFAMVAAAAHIFVRGTIRFPFGGYVVLAFARFICSFVPALGSTGIQLLEDLPGCNASLSTQYRVFLLTDDLRATVGIKSQSHLLHAEAARSMHCKVLTHMNSFWLKLTEPSVNIGQVSSIADDITESRKRALVQFRRAIQHQTSPDPHLIARMGSFLSDVMLDAEGAQECFNEAKEVHEARQARSMRGTRQHTTMLDHEALTAHLLQLLGQRGDMTAASKGSSVVRNLLLNVTLLFLIIMGMGAVTLFVATMLHGENLRAINHSEGSGVLRASPQRFVSAISSVQGNLTANASSDEPVLAQEAALFSTNFALLTSGDSRSRVESIVQLLAQERVPLLVSGAGVLGEPVSVWGFGERLVAAFMNVIRTNVSDGTAASFLQGTSEAAITVFNRVLEVGLEEHLQSTTGTVRLLIGVYAISLSCIAAIYIAFLVSFQRTQLGRIFTFQLFTLIPFDALEKLSTETRDKINAMAEEEKQRRASSAALQETSAEGVGHSAAGGAGASNDTKDDVGPANSNGTPEASHSRSHSVSASTDRSGTGSRLQSMSLPALSVVVGTATSAQVQSCLRRPGVPPRRVGLKVAINPNVVVFGGHLVSNGDEAKSGDGAARAAPGDNHGSSRGDGVGKDSTGADDDDEVTQPRVAARPREVARSSELNTNFRMGLVGAVLAVLLLLVAAIAFTAVSLVNVNSAVTVRNQALEVDHRFHKYRVRLLQQHSHLLEFTFTHNIASLVQFFALREMDDEMLQYALQLSFEPEEASAFAQIRGIEVQVSAMFDRVLLACASADPSIGTTVDQMASFASEANTTTSAAAGWATARALIVDAELEEMLERLIEQLSGVVSLTVKRIRNDEKGSNEVFAYCAAIFTATALLLCVCLSVLDVSWWSKGGHRTMSWLLLSATIAVPFVLVMIFTSRNASLAHQLDQRDAELAEANHAEWLLQLASRFGRGFVAAERSQHWFHHQAAVEGRPMQRLIAVVVDSSTITPSLSRLLLDASTSSATLIHLHQIASALMIAAAKETGAMTIEELMQRALQETYWNFDNEPDARIVVQANPDRAHVYSSRVRDLALPPEEKVRVAENTVFGSRYRRAASTLNDAVVSLMDGVRGDGSQRVSTRTDELRLWLIASLALLGVPVLLSMVHAWLLAGIVLEFLGLSAGTATNTLDTSLYTRLLRKCRWSLLFIAVVVSAVFGVCVWSTSLATQPIQWLDLAAQRDLRVISSLRHIRELLADPTTSLTPQQLQRDATALQHAITQLAFGDVGDAAHNAVLWDQEYDTLTYGDDDHQEREAASLTFFRTMCESVAAAPLLLERGPFHNLRWPVESSLHFWIGGLHEIASLARASPTAHQARIVEIASLLAKLEPSLIEALRRSTHLLRERAISRSEQIGRTVTAVASLLLVLVFSMYVFVFFPMVRRLVEEEESARLLLRMIPVHVRDQVPAIAEFIETGRIDNAAELQKKFEASEKLLQNILPQKIAARLKSGESPIADMHPSLTILFTDFVGFTKRSSAMQADEIVDFLNEVFLDFDLIVDLLELEKIKTIGDAYFLAGGLDPRIADHALRVVEAGLLMFQSLSEHNERHPSRPVLRMRLGVHTGPAVAGVIGTKKVAYDLWGESVEIANAMETTAVPNRVHISETTGAFVSPYFALEPRGELPREKESIPDNMPKTYLVGQRLAASPYQHIYRPRLFKQRIGGGGGGGAVVAKVAASL